MSMRHSLYVTSLCMAVSTSVHVCAHGAASLLMAGWPSLARVSLLSVHSSADGRAGRFCVLATVSRAAVNSEVMCLWSYGFQYGSALKN